MERNLAEKIKQRLSSYRWNRIGRWVLCGLGGLVAGGIMYALILPAITMSNDPVCGYDAHTHTDTCWGTAIGPGDSILSCDLGSQEGIDVILHQHDSLCFDGDTLMCMLSEVRQHVHDDACFTEESTLICELDEEETQEVVQTFAPVTVPHVHTDDCYRQQRGALSCSQEERDPHSHSDECYTTEPTGFNIKVCPYEEGDITGMEFDSYNDKVPVIHSHDESCYEPELTLVMFCNMEETPGHHHADDCYKTDSVLVCDRTEDLVDTHLSDETGASTEGTAHEHTDDCYEITRVLTCTDIEYVLHEHSGSCYEQHLVEMDDGSFYEEVLVCELPVVIEHQHSADCFSTIEGEERIDLVCGLEEHTHTDSCYLRLDPDPDPYLCGFTEHIHTDECFFESGTPRCYMVEHIHTEECLTADSAPDMSYPLLPETPDEGEYSCGYTLHRHTDSCWNETLLVCGLVEHEHTVDCLVQNDLGDGETQDPNAGPQYCDLQEHNHTEACRNIAGEYVCGMVEHIHDEFCLLDSAGAPDDLDASDMSAGAEVPDDDNSEDLVDEYSCGKKEHEHTDTCWDNTGELICVLEGHVHNEDCLVDRTDEPEGQEDPDASTVMNVTLDSVECPFETQDYSVTFHISGPVQIFGMAREQRPSLPFTDTATQLESDSESKTTDPKPDDSALEGGGDIELEEPEVPMAGRVLSLDDVDARDDIVLYENQDDPEILFQVTEVEDGEGVEAIRLQAASTLSEEEVDRLRFFQITGTTLDGVPVDLSQCTLDMEITPKDESVVSVGIATNADDEIVPEDEESLTESMIATYTSEGETWAKLNTGTASFLVNDVSLGRDGIIGYSMTDPTNPKYTVQYYAYMETAKRGSSGTLTVIDTSGGKLPENGKTPATTKLTLDGGEVQTETGLQEIYRSYVFEYVSAPGLKYANIVSNKVDSSYQLKEIWIARDDTDSESLDRDAWNVKSWPEGSDPPKFTNRAKTLEDHPNEYILVENSAVIRLVYEPKPNSYKDFPANFYDYDISNGETYRANATAIDNKIFSKYVEGGGNSALLDAQGNITSLYANWRKELNASSYGDDVRAYMYSRQAGINSAINYTGSGSKLAFGNANTNTGLEYQRIGRNALNVYNSTSYGGSYQGCTFGIAESLADGKIQYDPEVVAPSLFNDGSAIGKTTYSGYSLKFKRVGDTYTLSAVNGTDTQNLESFSNPANSEGIYDGHHYSPAGKLLPAIWTNNFWPMDSAPSFGTDGHDFKFGRSDMALNGTLRSSDASGSTTSEGRVLPESDDGQYHNSYFGMQFEIEFDVTSDYIGPLEYIFFGDDDMWVFLDGQLICDIGGIHPAVGEYVNLWDYIDKSSTDSVIVGTDGANDTSTTTHKLDFFYTERGAGGSTCWMQFTLPTVVSVQLEQVDEDTGSLRVRKVVSGIETPQTFNFHIDLEGATDYYNGEYYRVKDSGEIETVTFTASDGFDVILRSDEELVINGLPDGTQYTVTEIDETRYGYYTTYVTTERRNGEEISLGEEVGSSSAGVIHGGVSTAVVFTNHSSYSLPSTGASTIPKYIVIGLLVCLCGFGLWWYCMNDPQEHLYDK